MHMENLQSFKNFELVFVRQAGTWDPLLGPGTFCCSAAMLSPEHTSPRVTKYKETVWD